jgi:hypothetical protein
MNLNYVSVENSKYQRDYCPPGLDKSTASLTYSTMILSSFLWDSV